MPKTSEGKHTLTGEHFLADFIEAGEIEPLPDVQKVVILAAMAAFAQYRVSERVSSLEREKAELLDHFCDAHPPSRHEDGDPIPCPYCEAVHADDLRQKAEREKASLLDRLDVSTKMLIGVVIGVDLKINQQGAIRAIIDANEAILIKAKGDL